MNLEREETSELKLYGQVLWRRRWEFLATVTLVMGAAIAHTLTQPKIYESSLLLLVSSKEQTPQVVSENRDENSRAGANEPKELDTEVQVLSTLPLVSRALDTLRLRYPELDAKSVAEGLKIRQIEESGIISVTYRDSNRTRLLEVLSQLGATYVDFSLDRRKSRVEGVIQFIQKTIPEAQRNLALRSRELEAFRKKYNLVDPSVLGASMAQSLSNINEQQMAVTTALQQSQALYQSLKQQSRLQPEQAIAAVSLSQDPIYLDLLKQYQEAENSYSLNQERFRSNSPQLQKMQANRDKLKQILENRMRQVLGRRLSVQASQRLNELQIAQVGRLLEVENTLKIQQAQLAALQNRRRELEKNFQTVPELQRQYDNLVRQVGVSSKSIDTLLTKLEELRIVEAQEAAPWQVIQPPYPAGKPVSPSLPLNFAIGLVIAVMSGVGVVYLREQFDNRLGSISAVREILPISMLGVVPQVDRWLLHLNTFSEDESLALSGRDLDAPTSSLYFREAIRYILFSLRLAGADEPMKVVGLTSSTSSEGKSTITRHLGISAAEVGSRVLLVDADLRKPELHLALKVPNEQGLSNILATGIPWQSVVQDTAQRGLQVITSGPLPPNPVALFDSLRMSQLIQQLREHYDFVFVDLPPVVGLTDPIVVATHLDGIVLTIGLNRATRDSLKASLEALSRTRSRAIGAICNMADVSEMPISTYLRENKAKTFGKTANRSVQDIVVRLLQQGNRRK